MQCCILDGFPHVATPQVIKPGKTLKLVYSGDFVKGAKEGQGTCYFSNGEVYTGAWVHNKRTGYGKLAHMQHCNSNHSCWAQQIPCRMQAPGSGMCPEQLD